MHKFHFGQGQTCLNQKKMEMRIQAENKKRLRNKKTSGRDRVGSEEKKTQISTKEIPPILEPPGSVIPICSILLLGNTCGSREHGEIFSPFLFWWTFCYISLGS